MRTKLTGRTAFIILLAVLCLQTLACKNGDPKGPAPASTQAPLFAVDSQFREFHQTLGGDAELGPSLTNLFEDSGKQCQYTESALMCYDPTEAEPSRRFSLAPLGHQLNLVESVDFPISPEAGGRDLGGGFYLFPEFEAKYDQLFGALYVGLPLTQVRINHRNQRFEQFFSNVGFYRNFSDPPGDAHLIAYGAYLCGPDCSNYLDQYWNILEMGEIAQPFEISIRRFGWSEVGSPLTQPYYSESGNLEQFYDNVLISAPRENLSDVHFRPLPSMMGIPVDALVERQPHEQLVFYEVENGLGHNVPTFLDKFIAEHGGRELSGSPISEFLPFGESVYRQCFENYCLLYYVNEPENLRVRMSPLGYEYLQNNDPGRILKRAFNPDTIQLVLEEEKAQIGENEDQTIRVHVLRRGDLSPLYLVEGKLELNLPDTAPQSFRLKPTDHSGISQLTIPPVSGLPAMSVVEYKVCLNLPSDEPICAVDSYIYRGD